MAKIPLNDMLFAIDTNDYNYYNTLEAEQKKEFSSWLSMRYTSASKNNTEHYLLMVNDLVNEHFSSLTKHPELQWKLLCVTGVGSKQYHNFIKPPRKKGKNKVQEFLAKVYVNANQQELEVLEKTHSVEDLSSLAKDFGFSDKDIADLTE